MDRRIGKQTQENQAGSRETTTMNHPVEEEHMDPLEEGAVHPAMPQETTGHGAQTSEEVQMATDRPQTNDRRKTHGRLGDVIP